MSADARGPIESWRRAEATIGRDRALERAAARLPARLGWLLRAIHALDGGDRERVVALAAAAAAAGQGEVAAVLEVALADAAALDPTRLRRRAKQAGLGAGMALPYLDLLRLFAARRAGKRTSKSGAIKHLEGHRPVLRGVVHAAATTSSASYFRPLVRRLSPRAEQVICAARYLEIHGYVSRDFLSMNYEKILVDLDPTRWPDAAPGVNAVLAWGRGEGAWPAGDSRVMVRAPEATRRALAGAILRRLRSELEGGRLLGLVEPASVLCALAGATPSLAALKPLAHTLHLKLEWLESPDEPPDELLVAAAARAPAGAPRGAIGRAAAKLEVIPPALYGAAIFGAASAPALVEVPLRLEWVIDACGSIPRSVLEAALAGLDPWRRGWARLSIDRAKGQHLRALGALPALIPEAPSLVGPLELFQSLLLELNPGRRRSREVARAADAFIEALAARSLEPGLWSDLMIEGLEDVRPSDTWRRVAGQIAAADPAGRPPAERAGILAAALRAEQGERVAALVRATGREAVRARPAALATRRTLRLMALMEQGGLRDPALAPLDRFLLKRGRGPLVAAIEAMEPGVELGLVRWWRRQREALGAAPQPLREMVRRTFTTGDMAQMGALAEMPFIGGAIDKMVDAFCEDPDRDLDRFFSALRDEIGPMLEMMSGFGPPMDLDPWE